MLKKRSIANLGICFVLLASLFFSNIILAQDGGSYDPWIDTNDDGIIDAIDLQALAAIYSSSGTPINKTEKLLELEARIDSLNASLLMDYYNITECDVIFVDASGDAILGYLDVDSGTLYVDNATDRVGIGKDGPIRTLDVYHSAIDSDGIYVHSNAMESAEFSGIAFGLKDYPPSDINYGYGAIRLISTDVHPNHRNPRLGFFTHTGGYATIGDISGSIEERLSILAVNGHVGIGTIAPSYDLHVNGSTNPQIGVEDSTNEVKAYLAATDDKALVGSDSNHNFTINTNGATRVTIDTLGNVGIGTTSPTTKLDVDGDTIIRGSLNATSITIPTTTRYYSIPGSAWQPYLSTYHFVSCPYTYTDTGGETVWFAPVNLPHGAVVTELRAWLYDAETTENIDVMLIRHTGDSYDWMASVSSSGSSISFVQYADSSIDYEIVDNSNYAYFLDGRLRSGDSNHKLSNARITYTITEPLS